MSQPKIVEGIPPELDSNNWFVQNIKPHIVRSFWFEAADGTKVLIAKLYNRERGEEYYILSKVALRGYMKSIMKLRPGDVENLKEALSALANA